MTSQAPLSFADFAFQQALRRGRERAELRKHVDEWSLERDDLRSYIPVVHRTDQGTPAYPPEHLLQIIATLQDDSLGNTVIIAPPGSAKTNTTIAACEWWLGRDPTQHIGYFSTTATQANRRSVAVRDTIAKTQTFAAIFPEVLPDYRKGWAENEWYLQRPDLNDKDASFMAGGVGAAIQGSRLDRVLLDDIADKKNMATALLREKAIEWLRETVLTRLSPTGRAVMICTRWNVDDPAGWAIKQGWRVIHIKGLSDAGESYWPSRWPVNKIACPGDLHSQADAEWMPSEEQPFPPCWVDRDEEGQIVAQGNCAKFILGSRGFNLTWQGMTTDDDSAIFKRSYWKFYDSLAGISQAVVGIFVDLAHEEKTEADYTAIAVWRFIPPHFYVVEAIKRRLEFPEVLDLLRILVGFEGPYRNYPIFIEETPGSKPLIQVLRREVPGVQGWRIEGRSKRARAEATVTFAEAGNVLLPRDAPWVQDWIEEHAAFPTGEHDDQVDTTTMALLRFTRGGTVTTW